MTHGLNSFLYGAAPVPGPGGWFEALSFLTFTAHILFMNAVLGIVLISFFRGLCAPRGAETHPVDAALHAGGSMLPKGLAIVVNLGVAPLLFLQVLYGQFTYSAAIIQGFWWLGIMLLVMTAYYGLYLAAGQPRQGWRTLILGVCGFLLLGTALMQTVNAALVLNPQFWPAWLPERGSALLLPGLNVILPRFMHSLLATFAVGGLCLALYGEMRRGKEEPRPESVVEGLKWFIYATFGQLVAGLWYFFSLPSAQRRILLGSPVVYALFLCAAAGAGLALWAAWRGQTRRAAWCTALVVALMIGMRAFLRQGTLFSLDAPRPEIFSTATSVFVVFAVSLAGSALAICWALRIAYKASIQAGRYAGTPQSGGQPPAAPLSEGAQP